MELSRRSALQLGSSATLAALLAACSSGSKSTQTSATGSATGGAATGSAAGSAGAANASSNGKQITFWDNLANAQQVAYFQKNFVSAYKGSKVQFVNKPNNVIDRLTQTALSAGSGPSVVVTPGPSAGVTDYTSAGYLLDLTPYAQQYKWDSTFAPWALAASKINGKLMSLPVQYETMVFYTNTGTVAKEGLTVPKTQDEFESFCTEAKGKGLVPIAAGIADYQGANEWHVVVALNHGAGPAAVYSALNGKTKWTDPVFVDAITRAAGYFQKGWFGGSVDSYFTNTFATVYKQLASGKAAAMISGTWEFSNLRQYFGSAAGNNANWDFTTLPSLGKGVPEVVWDLAIGQSAAVNAKAANVGGSVDYLNFLTTDKTAILNAVKDQDFEPAPIHLTAKDFPAGTDPRTVRLYSELSAAKTIGYTTWTFFPQQTETYIIQYWEQVLTKKITPAQYCAGIQQRFAKEFAAGKVPTAPKPGTAI